MLKEYTFYYRKETYPFKDSPDETLSINNHKVSKEIYIKLQKKVAHSNEYELFTTQNIFWSNHKTNSCIQSQLSTFVKKGEKNE